MSELLPDHLPQPATSGPGPRAGLWLGLRVLVWAVMLVLAFTAVLWILVVTAPEGGGALIGAPFIAALGPLLISVPWAFVRGWRDGQQVMTYAFWPAAYLLAALLGTPVLVWRNGWFTPGALPPGQALRDCRRRANTGQMRRGAFSSWSQHLTESWAMTAPLRGHDRRVGRRPMSAKREQFLKMVGQGWAVAAAARELGVSRSSANNWKNGYRVARTDGTVVVFEALTATPQPISARFLSQEERLVIADELRAGTSLRGIAALLGRAPSTISREVRRNRGGLTAYRPFTAEQLARHRRQRHHRLKVEADAQLGGWVAARLAEYWSPSQIARALPTTFPGQRERHLAHETIYRAVYRHQLPPLARGHRSCLRTGRTYRKAHRHPSRRRARFGLPLRMISDRPAHVLERLEAGHWEGDLIAGPGHRSNIATLVERATRFTILIPVPGSRHAELVHRGLVAALGTLPPELRRSITWDQGIEMSRHREVSADLGCPVFFCEKGKPWQRGSNENTNGLLRQYFPKGTDLSVHAPEHLRGVAHQLNHRPRAVLGGRTPAELFSALLPFPDHPLLRP